mgnify:CR=1 FL=1
MVNSKSKLTELVDLYVEEDGGPMTTASVGSVGQSEADVFTIPGYCFSAIPTAAPRTDLAIDAAHRMSEAGSCALKFISYDVPVSSY